MVRLATLSAALLGCGALLMTTARGEEAIPAESCETTDYTSFPEDEVGREMREDREATPSFCCSCLLYSPPLCVRTSALSL